MTKSEYVRVSPPEKVYGQKHLLQTQLELLNLIKSFHTYKVLRNEELVLKVTLKSKVEELINLITKLERLLPKAHYTPETREEKEKDKKKRERKLSLQEEIERVRQKLARIQKEAY
ncbi:MAG: hypothetical protein ABIH92_00240 [Nanoarchaeota archaeon]